MFSYIYNLQVNIQISLVRPACLHLLAPQQFPLDSHKNQGAPIRNLVTIFSYGFLYLSLFNDLIVSFSSTCFSSIFITRLFLMKMMVLLLIGYAMMTLRLYDHFFSSDIFTDFFVDKLPFYRLIFFPPTGKRTLACSYLTLDNLIIHLTLK